MITTYKQKIQFDPSNFALDQTLKSKKFAFYEKMKYICGSIFKHF